MLMALSMSMVITSCSDDDKKNDEPNSPKVAMAVSSMYGGYDGEEQEWWLKDVTYDNQGRPVSYVDGSGNKHTYTYIILEKLCCENIMLRLHNVFS